MRYAGCVRAMLLSVGMIASGCWADPTCNDSCDGSKISSCKYSCPSSNDPVTLAECRRLYGGTDCALDVGPSGGAKTCKMLPRSANGSPERPYCVDGGSPCNFATTIAVCTGPSQYHNCVVTEDGDFLGDPQEHCTEAGRICHPTITQGGSFDGKLTVTCVDAPLRACDPAGYPLCADATTRVTCEGTPEAGYAVGTYACPAGYTCSGAGTCIRQ